MLYLKRFNFNKASSAVILFNVIQIITIICIVIYFLININNHKNIDSMIILISILVVLNSVLYIFDNINIKGAQKQYKFILQNISEIEKLNTTLRCQRHDFINHMQVVYSLIEMEEFNEAQKYIDKVFDDIQKVSRFLKTSKLSINALLQAKTHYCENRKINVELVVSSKLENINIDDWELCKILSNIIDNAIFAVRSIEYKKVKIQISEDISYYIFLIEDNGEIIEEKNITKIFDPGFTTKGNKGDGMGLYIVKDLINKCSGKISVLSTKEKTCFEIKIPKNVEQSKVTFEN